MFDLERLAKKVVPLGLLISGKDSENLAIQLFLPLFHLGPHLLLVHPTGTAGSAEATLAALRRSTLAPAESALSTLRRTALTAAKATLAPTSARSAGTTGSALGPISLEDLTNLLTLVLGNPHSLGDIIPHQSDCALLLKLDFLESLELRVGENLLDFGFHFGVLLAAGTTRTALAPTKSTRSALWRTALAATKSALASLRRTTLSTAEATLATLRRTTLTAAEATLASASTRTALTTRSTRAAGAAKATATAWSTLRHQFGDLLNLFCRHLELFLNAGVHQEPRALKTTTHHWTAAHHAGTLWRTELPALGTCALAQG